ncbi:MAG: GAF domain-containing protein [Candidatus Sulfotelmatobacter sp.]
MVGFDSGLARSPHPQPNRLCSLTTGMNTRSNLDRETFQQLLASVFAVQESRMDSQSLSAIMEMQRLVAGGKLDVDGAMHLIVEAAKNVANASGVAVGLLKGGQLIYRAGSGSAMANVGRQVSASLTVTASTKTNREILRVENAQTDTRIEAAICRQFGANSLLILPIYHQQALAGILEVLFSEAHGFQDREVRTYRLMAEQIEAAIAQAAQFKAEKLKAEKTVSEPPAAPQLAKGIRAERERSRRDAAVVSILASTRSMLQRCGARLARVRQSYAIGQSSLLTSSLLTKKIALRSFVWRWNLSLTTAAIVLVLSSLLAYRGHVRASHMRSSAIASSSAIESQAHVQPPPVTSASGLQPATVPVKGTRLARATRRLGRARKNEIRHIGNDVTVRYFTYTSSPQPRRVSQTRTDYIGNDVTVRYFTPQPVAVPDK